MIKFKVHIVVLTMFLWLVSGRGAAQLMLERQVISCFALNTPIQDTMIQSTGGQVETLTINGENGFITQGFEQPIGLIPIQVVFEVYLNTCTNQYDVYILQITGCADTTSAEIYWNGQISGTFQSGLPALSHLDIMGASGCIYQQDIDLSSRDYITMDCDIHFYNFLSPNSDGDNDEWIIDHIQYDFYSDNVVKIYNRWGTIVWKETAYNNSDKVWKGQTQSGEELPNGTYYYDVEINGRKFNGFIELVR